MNYHFFCNTESVKKIPCNWGCDYKYLKGNAHITKIKEIN